MKSKKKAMNINKMKKEIKRNNLDSIGCYNNSTINISSSCNKLNNRRKWNIYKGAECYREVARSRSK